MFKISKYIETENRQVERVEETREKWGVIANGSEVSSWYDEKCSNWPSWGSHNSVNILKPTELYTLNGWIAWYINYSNKTVMKNENKDFNEERYLSRHLSELSDWGVWRIPGRENRKYKGPEEKAGLAFEEQVRAGWGGLQKELSQRDGAAGHVGWHVGHVGHGSRPWGLWLVCCCRRQVASVMSDSVRPHRRQPTRLHHPWDSPGKNTGVGCHWLLYWMR